MKRIKKICVIIPCYKVKNEIKNLLNKIDYKLIDKVFLIDDACPENSGLEAKKLNKKKVEIIFSKKNLGVGGATILGFKNALKKNYEFIFKIDGDGQHDPNDIKKFLKKFKDKNVNFCKGTRFDGKKNLFKIPKIRLLGNLILTFLTRINCSNYKITDAVNGFLCIRSTLLKKIDLDRISKDFFFEEDLLFYISFFEKNITEINIKTIYNNKSNLSPIKTILPFLFKHLKNLSYKINHVYKKK